MRINTGFVAVLLALFAGVATNALAADAIESSDAPAVKLEAQTKAALDTKATPHSHVQEKVGVAPTTTTDTRPLPKKSAHFHPRDGK